MYYGVWVLKLPVGDIDAIQAQQVMKELLAEENHLREIAIATRVPPFPPSPAPPSDPDTDLPAIIDQFADPFDLSDDGVDPAQYQASVQDGTGTQPSAYAGPVTSETPFGERIAGLITMLMRDPPRNAARN